MEHFPSRLTRAESDALVDRIAVRWAEDGHGLWAVERTADGAFLGFTGIARLAWLPTPGDRLALRPVRLGPGLRDRGRPGRP